MTTLIFTVNGTPRPKARPRFIRGRAVTTTGPKEKLWRLAVDRAISTAVANRGGPRPVFEGAVRVRMVFTFKPPASAPERHGLPHLMKPDVDNLGKAVLDAMECAGVFRNDSQVAECPVEKWWGERAGVTVTAEAIDQGIAAPSRSPSPDAPDWLRSTD